MKTNNEQLNKFRELINYIKVGVLTTQSADHRLKGRPMTTVQVDEEGNLWYFTNEFSDKAKDISKNNEVFVSYASPSGNSYVSVTGKASLSQNKSKMKKLWTPFIKTWFPEGMNDPKLALLKIEPKEIEYWEGGKSNMIVLFSMFKSIITGGSYGSGRHGKLSF